MADFRTQYQRVRCYAVSGSPDQVIWKASATKDGDFELVEAGKESVWEMIQASRDEADIHSIIKRFELGDASVFEQRAAIYADVTMMPNSLADMYNLNLKGKDLFYSLSPEDRDKFGQNYHAFIAAMDNPKSFVEKLGVEKAAMIDPAFAAFAQSADAIPEAKPEEVANES